jgi:tetratricopeptide (TPR) repeat protein
MWLVTSAKKSTLRHIAAAVLLAVAAGPTIAGQAGNPKQDFLDALGRFSLALDGTYGDEGNSIRSNLEALGQALARWDAAIRGSEAGMASELGAAEPTLAARMHVAMGAAYLDRNRVGDALREFETANKLDGTRANVYIFQGLIYSQLMNDPEVAGEAFRKAFDLDPRNPVRAYEWARHLGRIGKQVDAKAALQTFQKIWQETIESC